MKTLDNFIIERLKLNKDTKIASNYVLFIWPVGNNYRRLQEIYRNNRNTNQFYTAKNKIGIIVYVCDIDFLMIILIKNGNLMINIILIQ